MRPPLEAALGAFALAAVVTPLSGPAVSTRAIWLPPDAAQVPASGDLRRAEPKRVLALPLDGLPLVPRGAIVTVPEFEGGTEMAWRVDAGSRVEYDHYRLIVVPVAVAT